MLQNRVDPFGDLHPVPHRGAWFGNKGCLHAPGGRIRRFHSGKRWIICQCDFRGRKRKLVQPGRYTELFFLDEATAYAAGHRPCAECRRADWAHFMALWAETFGPAMTDPVDAALHQARMDGKQRRVTMMETMRLPDGAMILVDQAPVLRAKGNWWQWRFEGYTPAPTPPKMANVLTPEPVVTLMHAGLAVHCALP